MKVFVQSSTKHGVSLASCLGKCAKHTAKFVIVSASGRSEPPPFIAAGKQIMLSWLKQLSQEQISEDSKLK